MRSIKSKRAREAEAAAKKDEELTIEFTLYSDEELDDLINRGTPGNGLADLFDDDYLDYVMQLPEMDPGQSSSDFISLSFIDTIEP